LFVGGVVVIHWPLDIPNRKEFNFSTFIFCRLCSKNYLCDDGGTDENNNPVGKLVTGMATFYYMHRKTGR
jgi:hypothetical protein